MCLHLEFFEGRAFYEGMLRNLQNLRKNIICELHNIPHDTAWRVFETLANNLTVPSAWWISPLSHPTCVISQYKNWDKYLVLLYIGHTVAADLKCKVVGFCKFESRMIIWSVDHCWLERKGVWKDGKRVLSKTGLTYISARMGPGLMFIDKYWKLEVCWSKAVYFPCCRLYTCFFLPFSLSFCVRTSRLRSV